MSRTSRPSPKIRALAEQLLAYEDAAGNPSEANMPALFCVSEKLRHPLSMLAGSSGFRSLLARALTLAKAQAPALNIVQIEPDGSLIGFNNNEAQIEEAGGMLIAELLGLLVTFIGEHLMLSLVRDAWPDLPILYDGTLEKK